MVTSYTRRAPSGVHNQEAWNQRPPPSPTRSSFLPQENPESGIAESYPPWVTIKATPEKKQGANRCLEYTLSSLPMSAKAVRRDRTPERSNNLFHSRPAVSGQNSSTPNTICNTSHTPKRVESDHSRKDEKSTSHEMAKSVQYRNTPSPVRLQHQKEKNAPQKFNHFSNTAPQPAQRTKLARKVDHPPTNSSSNVTGKDKHHKGAIGTSRPLDDELESRKSDDRDSGAILDAEQSMFDFDSSVLSESETEGNRSPAKLADSHTKKNDKWSRSSTPILPAISSSSEDETPRNSKVYAETETRLLQKESSLSTFHEMGAKKQAGLPEKYERNASVIQDHQELSPTESAIADQNEEPKSHASSIKVTTKVLIQSVIH